MGTNDKKSRMPQIGEAVFCVAYICMISMGLGLIGKM